MGSKRQAASGEARHGGGRAPSSKWSRKGNKKKTAAHKRLLKLLHELPAYIKSEWAMPCGIVHLNGQMAIQ
jgi:hypothetical protein